MSIPSSLSSSPSSPSSCSVETPKARKPSRVNIIQQILALKSLARECGNGFNPEKQQKDQNVNRRHTNTNLNKQHSESDKKQSNRSSTSSLLTDVHSIFQPSKSSRSTIRSRPSSVIGISQLAILDFPSLSRSKQGKSSTRFRHSFPIASNFQPFPLDFRETIPSSEVNTEMTPSKEKKPLPSSKSTVFPSQPTSYSQWRTSLQHVKVLFIKRQWKECAERCHELLYESKTSPHPMHACYLHFYHALSTELIAQSTHNLSATKVPLLLSAKESYFKALTVLPKPTQPQPLNHYYENDSDNLSSYPPSPAYSSSPTSTPSPPSTPTRLSRHLPHSHFLPFPGTPTPSPLHISKTHSSIPQTPSHTRPTSPTSTSTSTSTSTPSIPPSTSPNPQLQHHTQSAYNTHLQTFSTMLQTHIDIIQHLIETTEDIQKTRHSVKRILSHGADEQARAVDRTERIKRGRENGWKRERFCPERCREVCARALEEL